MEQYMQGERKARSEGEKKADKGKPGAATVAVHTSDMV